ncbi:MAG: OsmC family protein [Chthoniobacterales bacterium]
MVKVSLEYVGDLRCEAKHVSSSTTLQTDAPVDNQGKGESFSPTDLVGTALGTCMATTMAILGRKNNIAAIDGLRIDVTKEMTTEGPRKIRRLTTEMWIPLSKSSDPQGVLERAAMNCPVFLSLDSAIDKPVTIHWKES